MRRRPCLRLWIYQHSGDEWHWINTDRDAARTVCLLPSSTLGYRDLVPAAAPPVIATI
ncbi:MAG: hypothetical protein R3F55_22225 [Alphaproteobacteria bacterium]